MTAAVSRAPAAERPRRFPARHARSLACLHGHRRAHSPSAPRLSALWTSAAGGSSEWSSALWLSARPREIQPRKCLQWARVEMWLSYLQKGWGACVMGRRHLLAELDKTHGYMDVQWPPRVWWMTGIIWDNIPKQHMFLELSSELASLGPSVTNKHIGDHKKDYNLF